MRSREFSSWMWGEALALIDRAERLQRRFFEVSGDAWEPPVDVVEDGDELRVQVALPGVPADAIAIGVEPDAITVSALRNFPRCEGEGCIHRLEIPYGRFERRIGLPMRSLNLARRELSNGVLTLTLRKKEGV